MDYEFIGWCHEDKHDKVWGVIRLEDYKYVSFWGRRGTKLQTKFFESSTYDLVQLIYKKVRKGYTEVNTNQLSSVYPEFRNDLEKTAIWATLKL